MTDITRAYRAPLFYFTAEPVVESDDAWSYHEDGLLVVEGGHITACGGYAELGATLDDEIDVIDYRPGIILPGFIDAHVHYVQTDMVASPAPNLLNWLERYTFPAEKAFADAAHAREVGDFFIRQLLANGTTTAMVFASSHAHSVDALFSAAAARRMRLAAGKVMMDRHAPEGLRDNTVASYEDSLALIDRWHGRERLAYAVTPRFAPTSSEEQLRLAGRLFRETPGVYLQSHVAENRAEVAWMEQLFPASRSYLDVYDRFGLLGERALYAHGIYLDDQDRRRMAETGASLVFCPSSNLFLGSGLLDVKETGNAGVRMALGSDIGAGTSFSMLRNMQDGYKIMQLKDAGLNPLYPLYLATLGAARALRMEHQVGSLEPGHEADFIVLEPQADELLERRLEKSTTLVEQLFVLMMLGGRHSIRATYCMGEKLFDSHREARTEP